MYLPTNTSRQQYSRDGGGEKEPKGGKINGGDSSRDVVPLK